ncbi:hypothetical protein JOB18_015276 [Solea senegalensis]|uniref:Uncharacterized protein n=1 Tax=Solea senegalensis TaxID=28829 RepID=A0AAV6R4J2_SOLSE|nr:hypothetical protein JOB18_015276 [Solea senegalensis]
MASVCVPVLDADVDKELAALAFSGKCCLRHPRGEQNVLSPRCRNDSAHNTTASSTADGFGANLVKHEGAFPLQESVLLHQFCTVPAWRGVRERKEEQEERIW